MKSKIQELEEKKEDLNKNLVVTQNELERLINFID